MVSAEDREALEAQLIGRKGRSYSLEALYKLLAYFGSTYNNRSHKASLIREVARLATIHPITRSQRIRICREPLQQQPVRQANLIECQACYENLPSDLFPARRITTECQHEETVCLACLSFDISTQLKDKVWNQLACTLCSAKLQPWDVKEFTTEETFER